MNNGAVVWLVGSGAWFLTGILFPVGALPPALRTVPSLLPITYSLEGMRLALVQGAPLARLGQHLIVLGAFCLLLLHLSLAVFPVVLRRARLAGTLSFY